jgi:multiple sugar transport system substrate-binding protein
VPYHDGPECLIYRTDLLRDVPRTWGEFHQTARRLHSPREKRYGAVFAGYPDGHNNVYDFCLQLWSRGGDIMNLTTDAARQALRFYREIRRDESAVHPRCGEFDSVKSGYAFASGEVAMMVNWFGFAAMCQTAPESKVRGKVAVADVPGGISLNVYWTLAIPSTATDPALSWKFLRHCASAPMDKLLTLEGGIGCRKSTWADADVNAVIPFYREMERLHIGARELPRRAQWSRIASEIDALVLQAMATDRPEGEMLAEAQQQIEAIG